MPSAWLRLRAADQVVDKPRLARRAGVVEWLIGLVTPSLFPLLSVEVTVMSRATGGKFQLAFT